MQLQHLSPNSRLQAQSNIPRSARRRKVHHSVPAPGAEILTAIEPSPLHSLEALAATVFVSGMVACWIAVASTATAPLVAAGEILTRVARVLER